MDISFATACLKYFGLQPGQGLTAFQAELKQLTDKDRAELKALFASVGFNITN